MEQRRDEQIPCADCGASFVFSANEAAVFADRGLSPPKRCKDCRRARKDRASGDGSSSSPAWQGRGGAMRQGAPRRYTGDVNEYRSPMADGLFASPYGTPANGGRGGQWRGSGEYRSPMVDGNIRHVADGGARAPRLRPPSRPEGGKRAQRGPAPARHNGGDHGPAGGAQATPGQAAQKPPRQRPPAELFSITCTTCGAQADVPFKPAEGRDVFCQACYRARRPAS